MEELAGEGHYPSGSYLPALARGFAAFEAGDCNDAIEAPAPIVEESERIGGSRAQHDLNEFTLLKAYINAGRLEEARRLLGERRPGASGVPVSGVGAVRDRGIEGSIRFKSSGEPCRAWDRSAAGDPNPSSSSNSAAA